MATTKISVVTACLNQEATVAETITSVLSQKYPELEYTFVDGASTDSTLSIAHRLCDDSAAIISEPDEGHYDAIEKGFSRCSGEVMAWLNGDDLYFPWTFSVVDDIFSQFPEVDWIMGCPTYCNGKGQLVKVRNNPASYPRQYIANGWFCPSLAGYLQQESMFWRRSLWDRVGGLDPAYKYAADFDLWTRFAQQTELVYVDVPLASFRLRPGVQISSKYASRYEGEVAQIAARLKNPPRLWRWLGGINLKTRYLVRSLIFKKSPMISHCIEEGKWTKNNLLRPLSRVNFTSLRVENWCRGQKVRWTTE